MAVRARRAGAGGPGAPGGAGGEAEWSTRASRLLLTEGRGQEISEDVRKDKPSLKRRASSPHTVCR